MDRLQYPVVRITKCAECIHNSDDYCEKEERLISKVLDSKPFPKWCRLQKVDDLKKELA